MHSRTALAAKSFLLLLTCFATLLCGPRAAGAAGNGSPPDDAIAPLFQQFFDAQGGSDVFGAPLTGVLSEAGRNVQYFERARFERHPEFAGTENEVMLGLLGQALAAGRNFPPGAPGGRGLFFAQTGHTLDQAFQDYWLRHNGLRLLGYPISEEFAERDSEDSQWRTVQYFERGRLAWDAERGRVQPGRVGTEWLAQLAAAQISLPNNPEPAISAYEQQVLTILLEARRAAGAPAVQLDPALIALGRERSADMATRNYFSHVTPEGTNVFQLLNTKGVPWATAGEIIARNNAGTNDTASLAARSFLNSPAHRSVIVDPQYNYVGVGHAVDSSGMHYFTLVFVRR